MTDSPGARLMLWGFVALAALFALMAAALAMGGGVIETRLFIFHR
jgi:hypothetical protein